MSIKNILKTRLITLLNKSMLNYRNLFLVRKCPAEVMRALPSISNYISFAFLSMVYVAHLEEQKENSDSKIMTESAVKQSDELFSIGKFQESANVLKPFEENGNAEVLWRISRAFYNMSKERGTKTSENAELINKAYDCIEKALKLDENNFSVQKWMAILYDAKCALDGIKARINALPIFKKHLMKAIELNPKDATSIYMLGQYMYNIADMSWFQKTIAKALFGTPPKASFEEAFYYFSKAEEVDPNFYSANLLMLGKTCLKLKKIEAGCYWLKCAIAYPVRTDEDEAVRLEAEELLHKYPEFKQSSKVDEKNTQNA